MAILHVLRRARGHLSPLQVFARARRTAPGLTQPTVYRTLEFLADNGFIWQTIKPGGHLAYELAERTHNHFVCRRCGNQLQIDPRVLEGAYQTLEAASGYALDHSHVNLSGLCPRCKRERSLDRRRTP
jgi:Fe2+ or Zn2+ uptake regulation protein